MPIPLTDYAAICNEYCLCYYGPSAEFLLKLVELRPQLESKYEGVNIHIACRNSLHYLVENQERIVSTESLKEMKRKLAYIREIRNIEEIFEE